MSLCIQLCLAFEQLGHSGHGLQHSHVHVASHTSSEHQMEQFPISPQLLNHVGHPYIAVLFKLSEMYCTVLFVSHERSLAVQL